MSGVSKEEFERDYAEQSGIDVEDLRVCGLYAEPCDCGQKGCPGWLMASRNQNRALAR